MKALTLSGDTDNSTISENPPLVDAIPNGALILFEYYSLKVFVHLQVAFQQRSVVADLAGFLPYLEPLPLHFQLYLILQLPK